jgi:hypothetical protein
MKPEKEIEKMLDTAEDEKNNPTARRNGMTYEEGVQAALEWVLGRVDDDENPFA